MMKNILISGLLIFLFGGPVNSQKPYQLIAEQSQLSLEGTSTMHDWHMDANDFVCNVMIDFEALNNKQITSVLFKGLAEKVLSDKQLMDKKAHKAMKSDKFPEIEFVFENVKAFTKDDKKFSGIINGNLTLAGESKEIEISFIGSILTETQFEISGSVPIKMTDYDMKPPAFMFGAVKTGDDIKMNFHFVFKTTK